MNSTNLPEKWQSALSAANVLLVASGFAFRHAVQWWLDAGGWTGIKLRFWYGNNPPQPPKPPAAG